MKLNSIYITLACGIITFSACSKSNSTDSSNNYTNGNNTPGRSDLLEAGKWQVITNTVTTIYKGKDTTIDMYALTDECDKDDFIIFASNGTATVDENTNKCADDQQIENFTWALLNNDTKLALVDSNPDTVDIVELTATEMKLKMTKPNSSGVETTMAQTLKNIK
jgi:hypothetical protein